MSIVNINGRIYKGQNIQVRNNKVYIDGKEAEPVEEKVINITVEGDVHKLHVDVATEIVINGNAGIIESTSGPIKCGGVVSGDVRTTSGKITCGNVQGNIETVSGKIEVSGNVVGNVKSVSGSIKTS